MPTTANALEVTGPLREGGGGNESGRSIACLERLRRQRAQCNAARKSAPPSLTTPAMRFVAHSVEWRRLHTHDALEVARLCSKGSVALRAAACSLTWNACTDNAHRQRTGYSTPPYITTPLFHALRRPVWHRSAQDAHHRHRARGSQFSARKNVGGSEGNRSLAWNVCTDNVRRQRTRQSVPQSLTIPPPHALRRTLWYRSARHAHHRQRA